VEQEVIVIDADPENNGQHGYGSDCSIVGLQPTLECIQQFNDCLLLKKMMSFINFLQNGEQIYKL